MRPQPPNRFSILHALRPPPKLLFPCPPSISAWGATPGWALLCCSSSYAPAMETTKVIVSVRDGRGDGVTAAHDVLFYLGLAYPNPVSSYLWVCYLPVMRRYLSTHMAPKAKKGVKLHKNELSVQIRAPMYVDRYLRIMGKNNTSGRPCMGQIFSYHGRVTNHRYLDVGFGHARGIRYIILRKATRPPLLHPSPPLLF